ncbi:histidinol-phosphate aminotransferase, partial [archaeon SCG-AAA382B04]
DLINERVKNIKGERNRIEETFPEICLPSNTNFLLMDVDARDKLLEDGIAVRGFHGELEKYIRVTVGRKKENKEFINSLKDFLNDHKR